MEAKLKKLWKTYQTETPILRIPFRKDTLDNGKFVIQNAYVSILSYSSNDDCRHGSELSPTPFDYIATIYAFDRSLNPIQYKPIFYRERELFSHDGFFLKNKSHLDKFVTGIRKILENGKLENGKLTEEKSLLPSFDLFDIEELSSGNKLPRTASSSFGMNSVKRFLERITFVQTELKLTERKQFIPKDMLDTLKLEAMMTSEETLEYLDFLDQCEMDETERFVKAFKTWDVDWDLVGKLRSVSGDNVSSYGYFNANYSHEIKLPGGDVKTINPRHEALVSYPVFANEIAKTPLLRKTVDEGGALAPKLLEEINRRVGRDTVIGKRLLKTIAGQTILTPPGWSAYDYVTMLAIVPDSLEPKNAQERDDMEFCFETMLMLEKATGNSIKFMMKGAKEGWKHLREKMVYSTVNLRAPQGMTEEFHKWLFENMPIDEWKAEENKDLVRFNITEYVNQISNKLPGVLLEDHLAIWLCSLYAPFDDIDYMRDFVKGIDDVINLFEFKVTAPLSVYLSGVSDCILTNDISITTRQAAKDILFYRDRSASDLLSLIRDVHANMNDIKSHGIEGIYDKDNKSFVSEYDYKEGSIRRIYRTLIQNEERRTLGLGQTMSWVPLVAETTIAPNGFKIVPLVDMEDLRQESAYMEHCVGESHCYERQCLNAQSNIFTVLSPDDLRKTTLEISLDHKTQTVKVVQNQAFRNYKKATADKIKSKEAVNWFVEAINQGVIEGEWEFVREVSEQDKEEMEDRDEKAVHLKISEMAEFNPTSISALSDSILPWRKYLDKSLRNASINDFDKFDNIKIAAKKINPYCSYNVSTISLNESAVDHVRKPAWKM